MNHAHSSIGNENLLYINETICETYYTHAHICASIEFANPETLYRIDESRV